MKKNRKETIEYLEEYSIDSTEDVNEVYVEKKEHKEDYYELDKSGIKIYGISKPKREIIKARIAHD